MRILTSSSDNLREKFIALLKDVYVAEQQTTTSLPIMLAAVTNTRLKSVFGAHLEETSLHIVRLERIFAELNETIVPRKWLGLQAVLTAGVQALIKEGGETALIEACRKVEQSEIQAYETLMARATTLDLRNTVDLLELNLAEEKTAEANLATIAAAPSNL